MARVKMIVNEMIVYNDEWFTPASGVFDMDESTAEELFLAGLVDIVDEQPEEAESLPVVESKPKVVKKQSKKK